ncbi:MAG: hypothetical protein ABSA46_06050 [Thermodesulfovibrionales bacterium]|jgi:hypothetical protein
MTTSQATVEVFSTAFKSLKSKEREAFLEKILGDSEIRHDIIDIAIIEQAKTGRGRAVDARTYFQKRSKAFTYK